MNDMNTTYRYLPGPENICRSCHGFIQWPDGIRSMCHCAAPQQLPADPAHIYWTQERYRSYEQELNEREGWRDGRDALAG